MFYLTTCDDGQILTSHHRDLADLLDCTKSFMRAAMRDDPAFDELLLRHNAEAATWKNPDDEMEALVDKFEEELSNDCPQIVWGEVPMPAAEDQQDPHTIERLLFLERFLPEVSQRGPHGAA